jgi:DNA polymerase-1
MFCADEGKTFLITDYSAIELGTLAQVLYSRYGANEMQKRINAGEDLHKYYASVLYNIPVEEVTKGQRQSAKAANFGFPGGLGIHTFIEFAEGYGLKLTEDVAQNMKNQWFNAFPMMKKYLQGEEGFVETLTKRMRANTTYCQEKNTPFQGLAADGAKIALYDLIKVGYKVVGFVHDEIITEVDTDKAEELLDLQEHIMVVSMKSVVPDVDVAVESTISREYCK